MLTREQVLEAVEKKEFESCMDNRDLLRLSSFYPVEDWHKMGLALKEGATADPPREWNRDAIIAQMKEDVDFGFEKALDHRGLSSNMMYQVVWMWLWILEDPIVKEKDVQEFYPMYGLQLFKYAAVKYEFPNPIGDDIGNEDKYEEGGS